MPVHVDWPKVKDAAWAAVDMGQGCSQESLELEKWREYNEVLDGWLSLLLSSALAEAATSEKLIG